MEVVDCRVWGLGTYLPEIRGAKMFRGGLVSHVHRSLYLSTLGSRVKKKLKRSAQPFECTCQPERV